MTTIVPVNGQAGFFQDEAVTPESTTDLLSAIEAANAAVAATVNAAAISAAAAATDATNANASALAAAGSASGATTSAATATAQALLSASSATTAGTSATSSSTSASAASTSASNAATSASNASSSATAASSSATTAGGSASAAATSATAAAGSATAANTSATNASGSATTATNQAAIATSYGTAILASAALTGTPTAPTATALTNTTQVATTAYADLAVGVETTARTAADVVVLGKANENTGRNVVHNGEFLIQQRGVGAVTANAYTADRWLQTPVTDTCSTTIAALVDADRTAIGDEAALWTLKSVVAASAGTTNFTAMEQRLESVQRYGGKSLTVSFWAKAATGTPSIGVGAYQVFGSGGSPSGNVTVTATPVVLSSTWTRYTVTLAIPTTIGKALGTTALTDFTAIRLWYSSGTTNNTVAGGIGVQSATFSLWGFQVEVGAAVTALEKKSYGQHWTDCLRFYQTGQGVFESYGATAGAAAFTQSLMCPMRVIPTVVTGGSPTQSNCTAAAATATSATNSVQIGATITATGGFLAIVTFTASADL